jgi:hypothetical protein
MEQNGIGFTRLTASAIVNEDPTLLYGGIVLSAVAASTVEIYEGLDAASGRLIATIMGPALISWVYEFANPLYLDRGLFVVIGAGITEATIFWLPVGAG